MVKGEKERVFFAKEFAKILLCKQKNACENCISCRLFSQNKHPDFLVIEKKNFIEITQIQSLIQEIFLPPAINNFRIVLLKEIESMNEEAANSFLKILEEHPLSCCFILTTTNEKSLLKTILSRCHKIFFPDFSLQEIEKIILSNTSFSKKEIAWSFPFQRLGIRRKWLLDIDKYLKIRDSIWGLLSQTNIRSFVDILYSLGEDKEDFSDKILFFNAFLYDTWLISQHSNCNKNLLYSSDLLDITKKASDFYHKDKIYSLFQEINKIENSVNFFANKSLAWVSLIIQVKNILK